MKFLIITELKLGNGQINKKFLRAADRRERAPNFWFRARANFLLVLEYRTKLLTEIAGVFNRLLVTVSL